jgi:negative regulator of flagellin synthesis FlgM
MKIDVNSPTAPQMQAERSPKQTSASLAASGSSETDDRTTLNSSGNSIQRLTTQAMQSPEIRQDKVDSIRQAVDSGQYQVDPAKIADAMIANEGE